MNLVFDIAAVVIIALCAALGFKLGFAVSLAKLGGWIGAILIAILTHNKVEEFLIKHTSLETKLNGRALDVCNQFIDRVVPMPAKDSESEVIDAAINLRNSLVESAAKSIASHAFTIFVFIGIISLIALTVFVLTLIFSKKYNEGFAGFFDGFLGLLFGLVGGVALVMLILALLMPIKYVMSSDTYDRLNNQIEDSVVVEFVYENNPLLETIDGFMPNDLDPNHWLDGDSNDEYTPKQWGNLV